MKGLVWARWCGLGIASTKAIHQYPRGDRGRKQRMKRGRRASPWRPFSYWRLS
jgi:hypothetical protein